VLYGIKSEDCQSNTTIVIYVGIMYELKKHLKNIYYKSEIKYI